MIGLLWSKSWMIHCNEVSLSFSDSTEQISGRRAFDHGLLVTSLNCQGVWCCAEKQRCLHLYGVHWRSVIKMSYIFLTMLLPQPMPKFFARLLWHNPQSSPVKQETFTSNLLSLFSQVDPSHESFLLENYAFDIKIHVRNGKTWFIISLYMYDMLNSWMAMNISCFTVILGWDPKSLLFNFTVSF